MTAPRVPTLCAACNRVLPRSFFNSARDNSPLPNCKECKNERETHIVYKTCGTCKETFHRAKGFNRVNGSAVYHDDCKVCRKKVADAKRAEKQERLAQRKRRVKKVDPVVPVRNEHVNAFHWREFVQPLKHQSQNA
jgi:hypothetical protein